MALSRNWTYADFWRSAYVDDAFDPNNAVWFLRHKLMDEAIEFTATLFYDLMGIRYLTDVTIVPDTTGRYSASSTGTFTAATKTVTFVNMNTNFGSGDPGKIMMFRVGALVYVCRVTAFVDADNVTVDGNNLPSTNQTIDYILLASTPPTGVGSYISTWIGDLKIMSVGQQIRTFLESSSTVNVDNVDITAVINYRSSADANKNRLVWALSGENILLAKGSSLSTYGTLTLRYPRVPYVWTADTDYIDLPDGAPVNIAILKLKSMVQDRMGRQKTDYSPQLEGLIQTLYRTFGGEASAEVLREKIKALR
jgi:hypothetical protein